MVSVIYQFITWLCIAYIDAVYITRIVVNKQEIRCIQWCIQWVIDLNWINPKLRHKMGGEHSPIPLIIREIRSHSITALEFTMHSESEWVCILDALHFDFHLFYTIHFLRADSHDRNQIFRCCGTCTHGFVLIILFPLLFANPLLFWWKEPVPSFSVYVFTKNKPQQYKSGSV